MCVGMNDERQQKGKLENGKKYVWNGIGLRDFFLVSFLQIDTVAYAVATYRAIFDIWALGAYSTN